SRNELLKVPRLGEKAFEQAAGFLRIPDSSDVLDRSAVHPESYNLVKKIAADHGTAVAGLIGNEALLKSIDPKKYVDNQFGEHSIKDIFQELRKPGLDPRSNVRAFEFAAIYTIEDVKVGMVVRGLVTNITRFGAFVD